MLGTPLKFAPTRYGNTGLLKFKNGPAESTVNVLIVAKYAYVPFGYSGVTQNLPLFSSRTVSSERF